MKILSLVLLAGLFIQTFVQGQDKKDGELVILAVKNSDLAEIRCSEGAFDTEPQKTQFDVSYNEDSKKLYTCTGTKSKFPHDVQVLIRVRTCENCMELETITLVTVGFGSLVTTFLIGVAVYLLSAQPKGKSFSGNKASDKVNLISNGDGDMYQSLNPGQKSEYQALGPRRK